MSPMAFVTVPVVVIDIHPVSPLTVEKLSLEVCTFTERPPPRLSTVIVMLSIIWALLYWWDFWTQRALS